MNKFNFSIFISLLSIVCFNANASLCGNVTEMNGENYLISRKNIFKLENTSEEIREELLEIENNTERGMTAADYLLYVNTQPSAETEKTNNNTSIDTINLKKGACIVAEIGNDAKTYLICNK